MTNSIKTTKYSSIFLTAILVAGTITALFPSFMVGTAQAAPFTDMDREKKEDKKSVSVSSLKCNNINVNVNGLELDVFPPFLGGEVAAEAAEPNTDSSSFAAGNNGDGSQINDFRFICINNNNNTVIEAEEEPIPPVPPTPPTPPINSCEQCFRDIISQQISTYLLVAGFETLEEACDSLEESPISEVLFRGQLLDAQVSNTTIDSLIACLENIGIVFVS
jgi:hypothetical protein